MLQHIDDIDLLFENLTKILTKKDGKIIITTPNTVQRRYYDSFNIFEDVPPVHISRFTESSFFKIAEKYNLELLDFRIEQGRVSRNCVRLMNTKYKNTPLLTFLRKLPLGRYLLLLPYILLALFNFRALTGLRVKDMGTSQIAIYQLAG